LLLLFSQDVESFSRKERMQNLDVLQGRKEEPFEDQNL
jgi:hypothetical protein